MHIFYIILSVFEIYLDIVYYTQLGLDKVIFGHFIRTLMVRRGIFRQLEGMILGQCRYNIFVIN